MDDPYLKRRYGFVHFETLAQQLEKMRCALTIAFIPYNYSRSDHLTVELLRRCSDRFSISVHGCDHTGSEFASLDEAWLTGTTVCALERMEAHKKRTQDAPVRQRNGIPTRKVLNQSHTCVEGLRDRRRSPQLNALALWTIEKVL